MLRPDEALTALFIWMLAVCADAFGVEVHAVCVMSSHYHLVCTVEGDVISRFLEHLNGSLAKAVNVLRRAPRGILWEPGTLGITELKTPAAVVEAIAYTISNPSAAGLVWAPGEWPGLNVLANEIGRRVLRGVRPGFYFRELFWPDEVTLPVTMPAVLVEAYGEDGARERIELEVTRLVRDARAEIRRKGWCVLGAVAARNVSPFRRAKSWETFGTLKPSFATGRGQVEEREEAIEELRLFHAEYRAAWTRYRVGERDVLFPYGTLMMRLRHRVEVAPAPS
ncbi:MAG: transposase [Sandaracinaceae bacterium]|nr:transposase [Sandaracinaceae bacterium]